MTTAVEEHIGKVPARSSQVQGRHAELFRIMAANLHLLRGKTLGYWCGNWKPGDKDIGCHAAALAKLANTLERTCRVCGCTDDNCLQCVEKTGQPCHWVDADLCSACV